MPDVIRNDLTSLAVHRSTTTPTGSVVKLGTGGVYEARDPAPSGYAWISNAVPASAVDRVAQYMLGTSQSVDLALPWPARLMGLSMSAATALTAGSITGKATRGGTVVAGGTITLGVGDRTKSSALGFGSGIDFAVGERVGVKIDSSSDWAPNGGNVVVTLFLTLLV